MSLVKNYPEPPFCEKEILRYAGCKSSDEELLQPLRACIQEVREKLVYKVCYMELPLTITEETCDFECMTVKSQNLSKNLQGCKTTILFAATIGVEIDRLIAKYSRISPSKALLFQAIGAERIEALCDAFCEDMEMEQNTTGVQGTKGKQRITFKPRFSPGYGDLPLEIQKDIFQILDCSKHIGVSLNDSLLMSPSKSVTAFVGLVESENTEESINNMRTTEMIEATDVNSKRNKCAACSKTDCEYRGV